MQFPEMFTTYEVKPSCLSGTINVTCLTSSIYQVIFCKQIAW